MRVRLRFAKQGKIRFTSHRDLARIWERALRRAELPVAYSEGFSPRPKLHFGLALSTGHESLGEYIDVDLVDGTGAAAVTPIVAGLPERLNPCVPVGIDVQVAAVLPPGTPSLQQAVTTCTWRIEVTTPGAARADRAEVGAAVDRLLAADVVALRRERKGRQTDDDVRPAILELNVCDPAPIGAGSESEEPTDTVLIAELATQPRGLRPAELVAALGGGLVEGRVCRLYQWIERDGAPEEPLAFPAATSAPHAVARAS
jgi:radical SAM-linked protein